MVLVELSPRQLEVFVQVNAAQLFGPLHRLERFCSGETERHLSEC